MEFCCKGSQNSHHKCKLHSLICTHKQTQKRKYQASPLAQSLYITGGGRQYGSIHIRICENTLSLCISLHIHLTVQQPGDHGSRGGEEHLPSGHRHSHQRAPKRWEKDFLPSHKSVYLVIGTFGGVNGVSPPPQFSLPSKWRRNATAKQELLREFLAQSKGLFF